MASHSLALLLLSYIFRMLDTYLYKTFPASLLGVYERLAYALLPYFSGEILSSLWGDSVRSSRLFNKKSILYITYN